MEINVNRNGFGAVSMGSDMPGVPPAEVGKVQETPHASRPAPLSVSRQSAADPVGLAAAEPVADIPDAALSRDDALGKLVNSVFNLQAPPVTFG